MSLTHRMTEMTEDPFGLSAAGHRCFHCGDFLRDPAVMWNGNDGQTIYLHGSCVEEWTPRLMRDALELRYAGKSCWNQLQSKRLMHGT
jgi:hypothetical protein